MKLFRTTGQKGRQAEQIAADYLTGNGLTILERNFRCRLGEIDIIARTQEEIVFVEVKSRHSPTGPNPVEAVHRTKQKKIAKTAQFYLTKHFKNRPAARFDVLLVNMTDPPTVEWLPNAFESDSNTYYL